VYELIKIVWIDWIRYKT